MNDNKIVMMCSRKTYREMKRWAKKKNSIAWRRLGFSACRYRIKNPKRPTAYNDAVYSCEGGLFEFVKRNGT